MQLRGLLGRQEDGERQTGRGRDTDRQAGIDIEESKDGERVSEIRVRE